MNWLQRHREKSIESSLEQNDEVKKEIRKAYSNSEALRKYTSMRSLLRSMVPQLVVASILAIVEYELIGMTYTIISIAIYIPLIYMYTRTLMPRNGVYLMIPTSNFMDYERMFVSEEIWSLVEKHTGLTIESGAINGRPTYWLTDIEYAPGTNIPSRVEIAWAHYNRSKYAMFESVLDDLTSMLKDTLLEMAKLKQMSKVEAIVEGTRQTEQTIEAITSAHFDSVMGVIRKTAKTQEEAEAYEKEVRDLLQNPEYIRALIRRKEEEEKEGSTRVETSSTNGT